MRKRIPKLMSKSHRMFLGKSPLPPFAQPSWIPSGLKGDKKEKFLRYFLRLMNETIIHTKHIPMM
jgi:hypothetical protein